MIRATAVLVLVVGALALAGCGNSRTPVPGLGQPAPPNGVRLLYLTSDGVILHVPRAWSVTTGTAPLLATISSGSAVVAVWRYRRRAPAPSGRPTLAHARDALLAAARRRDPSLRLIRAAAMTLRGSPAVELDALEHVGGQLRRVRSVHVYRPGVEVVLDAYAPPAVFHAVDHAVFSPIKRSLHLVSPAAA